MRIEVALLLAAAAALGQEVSPLFHYDSSAPLNYQESEVGSPDRVRVAEFTFDSPNGGSARGYLVTPARKGRFAGIVWQHGGGQDRQWFLPDAIELARAGAVSVLLDSPFNRPPAIQAKLSGPEGEQLRRRYEQTGVDIRRAVDLLIARGDVDPKRIAFAGLSFGAILGNSLTVIENRFKAFVLMVGLEGFARHYRESPLFEASRAKANVEDVAEAVAAFDAKPYLSRASAPLLFQAARFDLGVPAAHTYSWFEMAASKDKQLRWYDSGHMLNDRSAAADRLAWLKKQLKIR